MQHHAAITMRFTALTCKLAPIYAQNNTRTADDKSHAAIPMRSATGDSKTPYNYAHTQAHPKQLQATVTLRQKKRQTDRSCNRRTHEVPFIVACSHFTRKNTRFRAPVSSAKHSPCNIMQTCTYLRTEQHQNSRRQESCSHSNAICNRRFQNTL